MGNVLIAVGTAAAPFAEGGEVANVASKLEQVSNAANAASKSSVVGDAAIQTEQALAKTANAAAGAVGREGGIAAENAALENANFAQKTFGQAFSSEGTFAGRTVKDVAGALRSGAMKPGQVPVQYIVRDGQTLILNTRSAQALERAGIPRARWNAVNKTGDALAEARLTDQIRRNNTPSTGFPTVRQSQGR